MFKSSQKLDGKLVNLQEELWIFRKGSDGGTGKGGVAAHVLGRHVSLPLTSCSGLLLVILDGHDEEDEQGDPLNPCQEEEVEVQGAVVDVTCREEKGEGVLEEAGNGKTARANLDICEQQNGSFITKYLTWLNYTCGARGRLLSFLWTSKGVCMVMYERQFCQE